MKCPRLTLAIPFTLLALAQQAQHPQLPEAETHLRANRFPQAEAILLPLAKAHPRDVEILYRLAYVQFRQRNLTAARVNFNSITQIAPPALNSRYFLGRIALAENKPLEAIRWLEPVHAALSTNNTAPNETIADSASQLALAYAAAGQTAKAIPTLTTAIADAPWDAALYYRLARLHQKLGQTALAKHAFDTSERLNKTTRADITTLMNVAQALAAADPNTATREAASILDRPDPHPETLIALGAVYGRANLHNPALAAFERAATIDPNLFQAQFNLGLSLLKTGRAADSLSPLTKAANLLPQSPEAQLTLGLAAVMNQQYAQAVAPLEHATQLQPANPRLRSLLATAYLRTNAPAKAVPLLRELTRATPGDQAPWLLLVEALNAANNEPAALDAARQAQSRFTDSPVANMALAQQLARTGKYTEAQPHFERVLTLAPANTDAALGLADCLQRAGDHSAAITHYRSAARNPATALAAQTGLARAHIALRQYDEARALLEDAIAINPSDIALRIELARAFARLNQPERAAEQTRIADQLRNANPSR